MRPVREAILCTLLIGTVTPAILAARQDPPRPDGHGAAKLDDYNRALGVECTHCHVADQWADDSKPAKDQARKMIEMVALLNGKQLRGIGEVSCWTCHGGQAQPARLPQAAMDAQIAKWPSSIASAHESTKLTMAVYSASTGLRCAQCHDPSDWKRMENDRMRMVRRMTALFPAMQPFMPPSARTQCYMCHKGSDKPQKAPPRG